LSYLIDNLWSLPWFSDLAGIIGLLITAIGFGVTFIGLTRSKKAAEETSNAVKSMKHKLALFDTSANLASAIEMMDQTRRLQRANAWPALIDQYGRLKRILIQTRADNSDLPDDQMKSLQSMIKFCATMENAIESSVANNRDVPEADKLNIRLSRHIDTLTEIRIAIKSKRTE
jgi:hypothetical protein